MVSKPAVLARFIFVNATAGSAFRPSSSAAPMNMLRLAPAAPGRASAAKAQMNAMDERRRSKEGLCPDENLGREASVGRPGLTVNREPGWENPSSGGGRSGPPVDRLTTVRIVLPSSRRRERPG